MHEGEVIVAFLAFDAASRQKQTGTRVFRARFASGCYAKFVKKLKAAAFKKIGKVKREIVNIILSIFHMLNPQGVPPSGVLWEEVKLQVKKEYYEV